jgi:hypothetical protein
MPSMPNGPCGRRRKGALTVVTRSAVLVLSLSLLSGCAVDHVSPKDPTTFIPNRSAEIAVGQTGRTSVRNLLGAPRLASTYWGFDLFRADTEQTNVVFAVTPWPIPIGRIQDQLQRYTLVAYDGQARASAVASGIFRRPAAWRNVAPIETDFPSLHLRAADLMFFVDPEGARDVNMLVAPAGRDAFLQRARTSPGCTAVLGCGDRGCGDQLAVDAAPARRLPLRNAHAYWFREGERDAWLRGVEAHGRDARMPWLETLVAVRLSAGEHALEFSARHLGGSAAFTFACRPGEVIYLVVNATDNGHFMKRALVDWQIERADTMPERFARRPLVLLDDGHWYLDAEPSD